MTKKVTIKDIARELNTNYSTVSRALNDSPKISDATKQNVLRQAKLMGYQPNSFAQKLKKGYSNTIGLIVPRINRVFFSNVIHGVETIAKQQGFNVIICQSNESVKDEEDNVKTLLSNNVAGIIMSISKETQTQDSFQEILNNKIPFVMFDRALNNLVSNQVVNDNFKGAYEVTAHLIKQGYQKIIHFSGPLYINIYQDRLEGYKKALEDYKIAFNPNFVIENTLTKDKGIAAVEQLLKQKIDFDAIFASGDYSALGAILCLRQHEILVPEQVGVAGFANEPFTELLDITSVEQFSTDMGKSAASLLLDKIQHKDTSDQHQNIEILPQLIIRKSTQKL
ncbi:LacI family DNA-binding transcriptional regulator [Pedobacter puniceum]|jgi:LacI family transcriptional regulator|uniref:Substrate-binding domain-containing protein n=1 Tax=Pedobacter puniceum TaxID=2666136 RepID=A0A7K0FMC3_9SPHI|nr:LacI family DNA-binding transcriptional regulator [Pedobacter puniceum]MRX46575.1 substrate-binding domain-containing protein [Pedobacter puniceum]